ncbi:DUF1799 domain-containing protein [Sphingomonas panni]|uniref:DUF1799 domain-containing protein n=1 Tax=Sphingomonas panni TaxID=237612 RepID=UPI001F5B155E|nr:DUF1799 domain-containing protein [Sphingomonas panni]
MGLDVVAAAIAETKPKGFAVWAANMVIVDAFAAVSTQWRTVSIPDGIYWVGLDYVGAKVGLDNQDITLTHRQWGELRVMERAALRQLNTGG